MLFQCAENIKDIKDLNDLKTQATEYFKNNSPFAEKKILSQQNDPRLKNFCYTLWLYSLSNHGNIVEKYIRTHPNEKAVSFPYARLSDCLEGVRKSCEAKQKEEEKRFLKSKNKS